MIRSSSPRWRACLSLVVLLAVLLSLVSFERSAAADGADTCTSPPTLTGAGDTGTTVGRTDNVSSLPLSCNGIYLQSKGPDVVYAVPVGTGNDFSITVTPAQGYDVSIYLLSTCGGGDTCQAKWGADNGLAGQAETISFKDLAPGIYYLGIDSFFENGSGTYSIAVGGTLGSFATTTAVTTSAATISFGQTVTFTATVSASVGVPGGTVQFAIDGTNVATVPLSAGQATLSTSNLSVGSHTVTAHYNGATPYQPSDGTLSPNQLVQKANTTTVVTSSGTPATAGDPITFKATVSPAVGAPPGSVTFTIGATTSPAITLAADGTASFTTSSLTKGTYAVTAAYTGNANFNGSTSASFEQVVAGAVSTTDVTASPEPSVFGQSVTLTASVTGGVGIATGAVVFNVAGVDTSVNLNSSGVATLPVTTLAVGTHTITATYGGDPLRDSSVDTVAHQVTKAATTTTLAVNPASPVAFELVVLKATVQAVAPGAGVPGARVTFFDNGTELGKGTLDEGVATLPWAFGAGSHSITASYEGDPSFLASSTTSPTTVSVAKASTTTELTASSNPSVVGQDVTFTAHVTIDAPGLGTPSGTVTFFDGTTAIGTAPVDANIAMLTTSTLPAGSHSITAVYSGDADRTTSTSVPLIEKVNTSGAIVHLTSSSNPSTRGVNVTFTANVTVVGTTGTPTGTLTINEGATTLGGGSASGIATASTFTLSGGAHTITASYSGDSTFEPSAASLIQIISPSKTTTTLTATPETPSSGATVSFVAKVIGTSSSDKPTGTVVFVEGTSFLGSGALTPGSGEATFSTKSLSIGVHRIKAAYGGSPDFLRSESSAVTITVKPKGGGVIDPTGPDAGAPPVDTDAGAGDDGGSGGTSSGGIVIDGGPVITIGGGTDDSCGCRVVGESSSSRGGGLAVLGLGFASVLLRRRRSRATD